MGFSGGFEVGVLRQVLRGTALSRSEDLRKRDKLPITVGSHGSLRL